MDNENTQPAVENENNEEIKNEENSTSDEQTPEQKVQSQEENKDTAEDEQKVFETVEDSSGGMYDTTKSIKELATAETRLEDAKNGNTVETKEFYGNINSFLTKEQIELKFDDDKQAEYYEAVEAAKTKWLSEKQEPLKKLEQSVEKHKQDLSIASAIEDTIKEYPDYNHQMLAEFYHEELTNKEKRELDEGSTFDNLKTYFIKIYELHKKKHPMAVKDKKAPNIPDINNKPKTTVDNEQSIVDEQKDKDYLNNIGFRKL